MKTNRMNVGYRLVCNFTSTADKAPYLGVAVPVGSLAYGNILQRMLDRGTHMTLATAKYFLNELFEFAGMKIADDIVRINMGAVSLYPMIGGPFDSEDDEFRSPRNTLYIGATLSQDIRDAVSGITPTNLGAVAVNGIVKISSVMDLASETSHLIDGLKDFRIAGIDLTVPDGEDESLTLVAADGVTKVADITVVSTMDGQRITSTLASAVPAGTYYVRLVSHGLDPTAPLSTVLHRVAVKANTTPATVVLRTAVTEGMLDANIRSGSEPITLEGENLTIGEGDTLYMKLADDPDESYKAVPLTFVKRNTSAAVDLGDDVNDPIWAWIGEELNPTEEHDRITVKLVSHGGVPSSEPQTVTATAVVQFA